MQSAILCLTILLLGADPQQVDATKDLDALQGIWTPVSVERSGQKIPPEEIPKTFKVQFNADTMIFSPDGENRTAKIKLDPSTNPKGLDTTPEQGPKKGVTLPAIYELNSDTLKLCFDTSEGSKRPTEFNTNTESQLTLMVLKREKK